jgi:1-phosphofructokinase family hexose kinase
MTISAADGTSILIFSPNLAIDHVIELDALRIGAVNRAIRGTLSAGGKGANVARAAAAFGARCRVVGFVSGGNEKLFSDLSRRDSIEVNSVEVSSSMRMVTIVVDRVDRSSTVLREPGPNVTGAEWNRLVGATTLRMTDASLLLCTGSLPPGAPGTGYSEVLAEAKHRGLTAIVDATGEVLENGLRSKPWVVKVNLDEAVSVLGALGGDQAGSLRQDARLAAHRIRSTTGGAAIVTVKDGAALACDDGEFFFTAPAVRVAGEAGAGDAFLGALAARLVSAWDLARSCRAAVAAAASSVEFVQPGRIDLVRAIQLEKAVTQAHLP